MERVVFPCEVRFDSGDVVGEQVVEAVCCGLEEGGVVERMRLGLFVRA